MDHARPHETLQPSKSSGDKRPSESSVKPATEGGSRPFRRVRSPSLPRAWGPHNAFKPRFRGGFRGGFFKPRFLKDDHPFRKTGFGFQRFHHHHFGPRPRYHHGDHPDPKMTLAQRERERERQREAKAKASERGAHRENADSSCPPKDGTAAPGPPLPRSSSSREKDKLPFSFSENEGSQSRERKHDGAHGKERDRKGAHGGTTGRKGAQSREGDRGRERAPPTPVSRAAARNRAIQLKRREIEKIYHRDCDMFGAVVRMLISKDASLEQPIQPSLQDNLRAIGVRCVEAMQRFIGEYDAREGPCTQAQGQGQGPAQVEAEVQARPPASS